MASPLTVTTNAFAGLGASGGLDAQATAGADVEGGASDVFAALLDAVNFAPPVSNQTAAAAPATLDLSGMALDGLEAGLDDGDAPEDPEAIAAALAATMPIQTAVQPPIELKTLLRETLQDLDTLKTSIEAGQPLDRDFMAQLDRRLSALGDALGISLETMSPLDDLNALLAKSATADATGQLTSGAAPLAQKLVAGDVAVDASPAFVAADLAKSVGAKLAAVLQALDDDGISQEQLTQLGLAGDTGADAEIEAAIAKLVAPPVQLDVSAEAMVLSKPALKLTEPILSGKGASEIADSDPAATPATSALSGKLDVTAKAPETADHGGRERSDERKPSDSKAQAAAVAGPGGSLPDPQAAVQSTHVASRIDAASAPRLIQAGYQTSQQQLNLPQLAFEVARQANDGNTRFQIRLDPAELGRIDVKLDIDATGQVNARLTVEKPETLDMMQRDQRGLERALQQAGLDTSKTSLEFSLKQNPFGGGGQQQGQNSNGRQSQFGASAETEDAPLPTVNLYRGSLTASGVNIIA